MPGDENGVCFNRGGGGGGGSCTMLGTNLQTSSAKQVNALHMHIDCFTLQSNTGEHTHTCTGVAWPCHTQTV